jgi:hypothetical protein
MSASGRSREGRQHAEATKEFADMNRTLMSSPIHRGPWHYVRERNAPIRK